MAYYVAARRPSGEEGGRSAGERPSRFRSRSRATRVNLRSARNTSGVPVTQAPVSFLRGSKTEGSRRICSFENTVVSLDFKDKMRRDEHHCALTFDSLTVGKDESRATK